MKMAALAALVALTGAGGGTAVLPVLGVIDGDTIRSRIDAPGLPEALAVVSIRIGGIDAPETGGRARCEAERRLGVRAAEALAGLLQHETSVVVEAAVWDKFGGRVTGRVTAGSAGIAEALVAAGLAARHSDGPRPSWCDAPHAAPRPRRRP